ncbi:MAG: modification methylase [Gemmatimonadetes bacterium]|nr:modification methylase [Gemmatimonadota bacterium]
MSTAAAPAAASIVSQEYVADYPLASLKPHPRNPREGDIVAIGESIRVNGFFGAVLVQRSTGYIIAGNHRSLAAAQRGLTHLPVFLVDVGDAEALKILLVDNKANDDASYNKAELSDLLQEILRADGTLDGTGYQPDDLDQLLSDLAGTAGLLDPKSTDGDESEKVGLTYLVFGKERIPMTDAEAEEFTAHLESWKQRVGSVYGFVASLLAHR